MHIFTRKTASIACLLLAAKISIAQNSLVLTVNSVSDPSQNTLAFKSVTLHDPFTIRETAGNFSIELKGVSNSTYTLKVQDSHGEFMNLNPGEYLNFQGFKSGNLNLGDRIELSLIASGNTLAKYAVGIDHSAIPSPTAAPTNTAAPGTPSLAVTIPAPLALAPFDGRSFYYDAFKLKDLQDNTELKKILAYYAGVEETNGVAIKTVYKDNPYMDDVVGRLAGAQSRNNYLSGSFSNMASGIGGLDVTSLADGISKFLVKRTKEELNEAFFNRFREYISKDEYKDLRILFPQSYNTMSVIGSQIYGYEAYVQTLKESFNADFKSLPDNFPKMVDNNDSLFAGNQGAKVAFKSACYITAGLRDEKHLGNIIAEYPEDYLQHTDTNFQSSVHLLQLLSEALKDTAQHSSSRFWIDDAAFSKLLKDQQAFNIYLGLIYQVARRAPYNNIPFTLNNNTRYTFVDLLDTIPGLYKAKKPEYEKFKAYFKELVTKTSALTSKLKSYDPHASDSMKVELFYSYMNASLDIIEHGTKINTLPYLQQVKIPAEIPYYMYLTKQTGKVVVDVNRRNYAMAVVDVISIYDTISRPYSQVRKWEAAIKRIKEKPDNQANKDSITAIQGRIDRKVAFGTHTHKLFRYASFMAAVAKADNSDQVEDAIEAFAMPSGSARVKREAFFNVALNAYVGPYIGAENINNVDKGFSKVNAYGLTAPIGISAGWGWGIKYRWSTTLFVSLVDLGAVTAFRFRNDSISEIPKIQLKDLFSPGAFVSIGLPRCPLSVNLGAQMGPNLRSVSNSADPTYDYSNNVYWRLSASICVDIPMLNFYTSTRRKVR